MLFLTPHEAKLLALLFLAMVMACAMYACTASAYIVGSHMVFDRVVAQHGKGIYSIEQDVTFRDGIDTTTVKENWLVVDGGEMRLQAQADGLRVFRILKKKKIFWFDGNTERADEPSRDYYMTALLTRGSADEKRFFIKWNILPPETLGEKRIRDLKSVKNETEPFMRLSRTQGTIAYTFGTPSPVEGTPLPGLWIEQDAFLIRKMRSPSLSEIVADDYVPFSKGLWYPKSQTVTFDNHVVNIRVRGISSVEMSNEQKKQFEPSLIRGRVDTATSWPKTSLSPLIQEFYKRFR